MEGPPPTYDQVEDSLSTSEHTEGTRTVAGGYTESSFQVEVGLKSEETSKDQEEPAPGEQEKDTNQEEPQISHLRPTERLSVEEVDARMPDSNKGPLLCVGLVAASIAALLIVILVPLSFSDLEYYEVGVCLRNPSLNFGRW